MWAVTVDETGCSPHQRGWSLDWPPLTGAAADLAYARLLSDNVEGAAEALTPLWEVPAEQRKTGVVVRTARIGRHLARPHYHGSPLPSQLREQVEEFTRVSPPYRLGPSAALLAIGH